MEPTAGRLLLWAWMQSNHRYNPKDLGSYVMHLHEDDTHALSQANTETTEQQEEFDRKDREARQLFDALTDEERTLIRWCKFLKGKTKKDRTDKFPAADRRVREDGGWKFVKKEGGLVVMTIALSDLLGPDEIGERMGISAWMVKLRLRRLGPLTNYAIWRGWVE